MSEILVYRPRKAEPNFWQSVGIPMRGTKLYTELRQGFPFAVYDNLARLSGLDKKRLAELTDIAPATLQRRAKSGTFKTDESDKLYRFAEVFKAAIDLFGGDIKAAQAWLQKPVLGLGNKRPIDMLTTSAESNAVLNLIGRLEHGVIA